MSETDLLVEMDAGATALHRVVSVLAHQRQDVQTMTVTPGGQGEVLLRLRVRATPEALEQLGKRLRRTQCVRTVVELPAGRPESA